MSQFTKFPVVGHPVQPCCSLQSRGPLSGCFVSLRGGTAPLPASPHAPSRRTLPPCSSGGALPRGVCVLFVLADPAPASHGNHGEMESTGTQGPSVVVLHVVWDRLSANSCQQRAPASLSPSSLCQRCRERLKWAQRPGSHQMSPTKTPVAAPRHPSLPTGGGWG